MIKDAPEICSYKDLAEIKKWNKSSDYNRNSLFKKEEKPSSFIIDSEEMQDDIDMPEILKDAYHFGLGENILAVMTHNSTRLTHVSPP